MSSDSLNKDQQDQLVVYIATELETMEDEEFEDLYSQLDVDHQLEVDEDLRNFANNAIGSDTWDSDR